MKKFIAVMALALVAAFIFTACQTDELTPEEELVQQLVDENIIPEKVVVKQEPAPKRPDPNAEVLDIISVYALGSDKTHMVQNMDGVPKLSPQALIDMMAVYGAIEPGCVVKEYIDNGDSSARIVLEGFSPVNEFTTIAIVNTVTENMVIDYLTVEADGEIIADKMEYYRDYKSVK